MVDMPQPRSPLQEMRGLANGIVALARVGAITVEVFLRKGFGSRFIGGQAAVAFILMPLFGIFFPDQDQRPLLWFDGLFLLACMHSRLDGIRLRRTGYRPHSNYNGFPRYLKPNASFAQELRVKALFEPYFVGLSGVVIYLIFNQPLGAFLVVAAICLILSHGMNQTWLNRQATDMHDAMINQQAAMDRYQQLYGDQ